MRRSMHDLTVAVQNDSIIVEQCRIEDADEPRYDAIHLSPDQIDALCSWLQEARRELSMAGGYEPSLPEMEKF